MYNGYIALGGEFISDPSFELVNNERVQAYIQTWNSRVKQGAEELGECIDWLQTCDDCPPATAVWTNAEGYLYPSLDPAPWYDPEFPDSARFFGLVGLDIEGAEDSTRTATVERSAAGGGSVSRLRYGPREMVVRALAVAADDCALQIGLNWLRNQTAPDDSLPACADESMYFLDCCPSCEPDDDQPSGPCWADSYDELLNGPADCPVGTWWPSTYQELLDGPPTLGTEEGEWCRWLLVYQELLTGLPQFACDLGECLLPHLRYFDKVRITSGPTMLQVRSTSKQGAFAEVEFTIVAADPREYATAFLLEYEEPTGLRRGSSYEQVSDQEPMLMAAGRAPVNPFERRRNTAPSARRAAPNHPANIELPTEWDRRTVDVEPERNTLLPYAFQTITIAPVDAEMAETRVGVWVEGERVGGFTVPFIPSGGEVTVNSRTRMITTMYTGEESVAPGFARNFEGRSTAEWSRTPNGVPFQITVDQPQGAAVPFAMSVVSSEAGMGQ